MYNDKLLYCRMLLEVQNFENKLVDCLHRAMYSYVASRGYLGTRPSNYRMYGVHPL
jgi:hypothetical protein